MDKYESKVAEALFELSEMEYEDKGKKIDVMTVGEYTYELVVALFGETNQWTHTQLRRIVTDENNIKYVDCIATVNDSYKRSLRLMTNVFAAAIRSLEE